jgi:hypothetical protein
MLLQFMAKSRITVDSLSLVVHSHCRLLHHSYQPAVVIHSLWFGLGLLDRHPVLYFLHTVYIFGEFGGQV